MNLLHVLDELDRVQKMLQAEFPECKIGYSYQAHRVTWSAQIGPVLNADSPDILREAIKRAYAELLEKIAEHVRGASPAATDEPSALAAAGPGCDPVAEP
ncbi:MAG TPA: hypothetical protein VIZ43_02350 [Trebonia sp.]